MPIPETVEVAVTDALDEGHIAQTDVESDIGSHTHILSFLEEKGEKATQTRQKNLLLEDEDEVVFSLKKSVLEKIRIQEAIVLSL